MNAESQIIPFQIHPHGFCPDLAPDTPGIISDSDNIYPTGKGIVTQPGLEAWVTGLPATCTGIFSTKLKTGGTPILTAGTGTHLYIANNGWGVGTFIESDGSHTYTAGNPWSFANIGNDVFATNLTNVVQVSVSGVDYDDLTASVGSVPHARFAVAIEPGGAGYFLALFNLSTDPQGWAISGVNDVTNWGFDVATLGALGTLGSTPGPITCALQLRGGAVVFKQTSFYYGLFVGAPYIWQFTPISFQQGVASPDGAVSIGDVVYFIGTDDFYQFDTYGITRIENNLREWFFATADQNYMNKVQCRYDDYYDVVVWHFSAVGTGGILNTWIAWHRKTNRWTKGTDTIQLALPRTLYGSGFTINGHSVGGAVIAGNSGGSDFQIWNATPGVGYFTTGDIGRAYRVTTIYRVRPKWFTYPGDAHNWLDTFEAQIEGGQFGPVYETILPNFQGYYDFVQTARWNRLKFNMLGDAAMTGYELWAGDGGAQ